MDENIHSATHISDANLQLQLFIKVPTPSLIKKKEKDNVNWHKCSKLKSCLAAAWSIPVHHHVSEQTSDCKTPFSAMTFLTRPPI